MASALWPLLHPTPIAALLILILVDVPFDWASIGLTRSLLGRNLKTDKSVQRLIYSALDLVGALVLLVLTDSDGGFVVRADECHCRWPWAE